jgi:serine/threonine protein kinase
LLTGLALKDFNIMKTVGKGFLGSVRVVQLANGSDSTPFALKVMKKSVVVRKKQVNHTMQERHLLGQVDNPFIVKLRAAFQDSANLYLLMEFVNGGELFTAIRNGWRFKNDGAKFYASEIALALGHCHSKSIAYRDLKLENVLVDRSGHVKITDFGFAKVVRRTLTYTLCGTPDYQAPELILGHGHDMSVDWWALGILIFELLTGKTPFGASDSKAIYQKTLCGEPRYPSSFTANCQNITSMFLTKDKRFRLGFGSNGVEDVKRHPWFSLVDFDLVLRKQYLPPYLPTAKSDGDTCMFDPWPEEDVGCDEPSGLTLEQQQLFRDF